MAILNNSQLAPPISMKPACRDHLSAGLYDVKYAHWRITCDDYSSPSHSAAAQQFLCQFKFLFDGPCNPTGSESETSASKHAASHARVRQHDLLSYCAHSCMAYGRRNASPSPCCTVVMNDHNDLTSERCALGTSARYLHQQQHNVQSTNHQSIAERQVRPATQRQKELPILEKCWYLGNVTCPNLL